jgi:hypothetical protein
MPIPGLRRVGGVLLAVGLIDLAITIARLSAAGPYPAILDGMAIAAGIWLLLDGARAALWVRSLAIFLLAGGVVLVVAVPVLQPLDLTLTEVRLDPAGCLAKAGPIVAALCLLFWVVRELGRPSVRDAIISAEIRRWDMRIPAQAGGGVVLLICLMVVLALHGQSADLATSLALQQLGPFYRYHLSWISSSNNGHGTSVNGVVTAWNDKEIRQVLLHWETH